MINFATSVLRRVIIHEIHKKIVGEEHSDFTPAKQLFQSSDEANGIIKMRVSEACGKQSKSFILQVADSSPETFFDLAKDIWALEDSDFIERSANIASKLAQAQRKSNIPGGYLIIIDGKTVDNEGFILVIKAELQDAFATTVNQRTGARQLELVKDIFLSPAKKFFKIGILKQAINSESSYPNSDFLCMISDEQFSAGGNPAAFFYKDFLGFTIDHNEKKKTKDFYTETRQVIISAAPNNEARKNALVGLKATLNSDQRPVIDPVEFGETFLPEGRMRDEYSRKVLTNPRFLRPFNKNLAIMGRVIDTRTLRFRKVFVLKGPEENFDESVSFIESLEDAERVLADEYSTLIEIKGKPFEDVD